MSAPARYDDGRRGGRLPLSQPVVSLVVAVTAAAGLAGCALLGDEPTPTEPPGSLADCNHGPSTRGDDLQLSTGLHWLEGDHGYDEAGELFVCLDPEIGGTVTVTGPDGVDVAPAEQRVDPRGNGILRFEVRVGRGASGQLRARTTAGDTGSTLRGPAVSADDDGWSFREGD